MGVSTLFSITLRQAELDEKEDKAIKAALVGAGVILTKGQIFAFVNDEIKRSSPDFVRTNPAVQSRVVHEAYVAFLDEIVARQKKHAPVRSYDSENPFVKLAGGIRYIDPHAKKPESVPSFPGVQNL